MQLSAVRGRCMSHGRPSTSARAAFCRIASDRSADGERGGSQRRVRGEREQGSVGGSISAGGPESDKHAIEHEIRDGQG